MKKLVTLFVLILFYLNGNAVVNVKWAEMFGNQPEVQNLSPQIQKMHLNDFLTLTPKKYKEITGEKLGLKKSLELKAAQKFIKSKTKGEPDIPKGLYILLAIFGLAWVAMGVFDDWEGSDWIVNLILTVLCWLPGFIHALVKMKKYY